MKILLAESDSDLVPVEVGSLDDRGDVSVETGSTSADTETSNMEALEQGDCWRLLARGGVGMLATAGIEAPVMRPVNFALHDNFVLIRTGEGQILEAAHAGESASFAITEIDGFEHWGWSVVVVGTLTERSSLGEVAEVPLRPWATEEKNHFVGLSIHEISGRRLAAGRMPR